MPQKPLRQSVICLLALLVLTSCAPQEKDTAVDTPIYSADDVVRALSYDQLLALAEDDPYANGELPLGDDDYVLRDAMKGSIYLCNMHKDNPGSMVEGPWIDDDFWNPDEKISVQGSVEWTDAQFSNLVDGMNRILEGNGLPTTHTTGVFPVAKTDEASKYDPNPNTISAQSVLETLPTDPIYSETPYCMGGEVGIMLTGVPLFNGFDAGLRDAAAHEVQDACEGHPQGDGQYHYHSLSSCFEDTSVTTVLGYALDGFPITGNEVAPGKTLTTYDLDVCHGLISEIVEDGVTKTTYHYVMTEDFPYSASCFRAEPVRIGPANPPPR